MPNKKTLITGSIELMAVVDGADGASVTAIINYYQATSANTAPTYTENVQSPGSAWKTSQNATTWNATNKYLWKIEVATLKDSKGVVSYKSSTPYVSSIYTTDATVTATKINEVLQNAFGVKFEAGGIIKLMGDQVGESVEFSPTAIYTCNQGMCQTKPYGSLSSGGLAVSDITLKNILNNVEIPLEVIADAPIFNYTLKHDSNNQVLLGSAAQYWVEKVDGVVQGKEGSYSMFYDTLALGSAISVARKVKEQQQTIDELKKEIETLKKMIKSV